MSMSSAEPAPPHLTVTIFRARDLRPKNIIGGSKAYITLQLGSFIHHTPAMYSTCSPQWNSTVTILLPKCLDSTNEMILTVKHKMDWPLSDRFLGRILLPMDDIYKSSGTKKWFDLQSKANKKNKWRGRIEMAFQLSADPGSFLSSVGTESQPQYIRSSYECRKPHPTNVEMLMGSGDPVQPAAGPGLSMYLLSVVAANNKPIACPHSVSSSYDDLYLDDLDGYIGQVNSKFWNLQCRSDRPHQSTQPASSSEFSRFFHSLYPSYKRFKNA